MAYLFDTSAISIAMEPKRLARHQRFAQWLPTIRRSQQHTCTQVVGELLYRAQRLTDAKRRKTLLDRIADTLTRLTLLPHDRRVADHYATLRAHLDRAGMPIGEGDLWIGACAAAHGLVVVTANVAHFARLPKVRVEPIVAEGATG